MKRLVLLSGLTLAMLPVAWAQDKPTSDEQVIRKIENEWAAALVHDDTAATDRITTEDWHLVTPDGSVQTREQANADLKSGTLKFESFRLDDLKIRVYGDTAVVIGLETEKSSYKGKDESGQYRFTDVFIKRDGKWRAVSSHIAKVTGP